MNGGGFLKGEEVPAWIGYSSVVGTNFWQSRDQIRSVVHKSPKALASSWAHAVSILYESINKTKTEKDIYKYVYIINIPLCRYNLFNPISGKLAIKAVGKLPL